MTFTRWVVGCQLGVASSAPVTPRSVATPRTPSTPATPTPTTTTPAADAVLTQPELRSVVVRLSSCLSTLTAKTQRLLLLRAGVLTSDPTSRLVVARALRIGVAREQFLERAALEALQTAARRNSCGSPPVWIHVPAADRLVLVDPVLTGKPAS